MKHLVLLLIIVFTVFSVTAQPFIHSHNDYQQPQPFTNALRNRVFSLEADVYAAGSKLLVAHEKKEEFASKTLLSMYLKPIIILFKKYHGSISADTGYTTVLIIDIKENSEIVIPQLIKLLSPYREVFDRSVNSRAVQIVLSGERGPVSQWTSWPGYIFFDGRPYETYDTGAFQKLAFISDAYHDYINAQDSSNTSYLKDLVKKVHGMNKLLRIWGAPDNRASWNLQQQLGIDIINTDKVTECGEYFYNKK